MFLPVMRSVLAAAALSACAGAPVDMSGGLTGGQAASTHADLRRTAASLRALVDEEGWSLGGAGLMARLIRGHDGSTEHAVERYLEAVDDTPSAALTQDARRVSVLSRETASLAIRAASAGESSDGDLAGDLAAVEGALAAVRCAQGFFVAAADAAQAVDEPMTRAFADLGEAEQGLARAADALAERRWAARLGAVS
jgi:hypothetical protein